uniref:Uncharacterized protein n=1 Tax=Oryzias sinensis TaxID=183150 RepID=A0A8C7Y764_9TELE
MSLLCVQSMFYPPSRKRKVCGACLRVSLDIFSRFLFMHICGGLFGWAEISPAGNSPNSRSDCFPWYFCTQHVGVFVCVSDVYLCAVLICSIGLLCMCMFTVTLTCQFIKERQRLNDSYLLVKSPHNSSGETVISEVNVSPALPKKERRYRKKRSKGFQEELPPEIPAKGALSVCPIQKNMNNHVDQCFSTFFEPRHTLTLTKLPRHTSIQKRKKR